MEPSSGQNSSKNGNDTQAQTSSDEPHEKDGPAETQETSDSNNSLQEKEGKKDKGAPYDQSSPTNDSEEEQNAENSKTDSQESQKTAAEAINPAPKKLPVLLTYAARNRPRQPFFDAASSAAPGTGAGGGRGIPPPPSYYRAATAQQQTGQQQTGQQQTGQQQTAQHQTGQQQTGQHQTVQQQPSTQRPEHRYAIPPQANPLTNPFVNPFTNVVIWAPYPAKIESHIPAYLAHLADAEVVFVVQHLEAFEFFANFDLPNIYLIQNRNGETIYYVYETTLCIPCLCKNSRALQLHVMDMYQNEVIFMNKTCGCGLYFCCFPLIEVYSPPSVPIGAVIKKCHPFREKFNIVDADQNLLFRVYGDCSCLYCSRCLQYDFSIHALDPDETEVGFIRRDFPGIYQYLLGSDYYGVSFPANMDVRIKAVFLGALFLIEFLYFE